MDDKLKQQLGQLLEEAKEARTIEFLEKTSDMELPTQEDRYWLLDQFNILADEFRETKEDTQTRNVLIMTGVFTMGRVWERYYAKQIKKGKEVKPMKIELLGTQKRFYENQAIKGFSEEELEQMYKRYLELELAAVQAAYPDYTVTQITTQSLDSVRVIPDSEGEWDIADELETAVENIINQVFSDGKWGPS